MSRFFYWHLVIDLLIHSYQVIFSFRMEKKLDSIIINEVQLLLAEKRTSLAAMRTGITVLVLPLTVLSFLVVTSKGYDIIHVWYLLLFLLVSCLGLIFLGTYLILRAALRIRAHDRHIHVIKLKYSQIAEFIE
jgi:uncharacterized membrane protein YkgB